MESVSIVKPATGHETPSNSIGGSESRYMGSVPRDDGNGKNDAADVRGRDRPQLTP
jgi:hypothetical protein